MQVYRQALYVLWHLLRRATPERRLRKENKIIIKDTHAEIIIKKDDKDLIVLIDLDDVEKVKSIVPEKGVICSRCF